MNKKGLITIIIILALLVLGLSIFIVYDKDLLGLKNERKESNSVVEKKEDTNTTKEIDVDSELVKNLVSKVGKYTIMGDLRNVIPYSSKEVVLKNDISDEIKGAVAFNASKIDQKYLDNNDTIKENGIRITDEGVSIIRENFENLFGYDGFNGAGGCPQVEISNNKYYEITGCGYGPYINTSALSVLKAEKDNDDIVIDAKVVFAYWDGPSDDNTFNGIVLSRDKYYEEIQNVTNKLEQNTYIDISRLDASNVNELYSALEKYAKDNASLLDTYTYRFKKYNNNYYLYSVKKYNIVLIKYEKSYFLMCARHGI